MNKSDTDISSPLVEAIEKAIKNQIHKFGQEYTDRLLKEYTENLSKKLAEITSAVSMQIFEYVTMERFGTDLRISIKLEDRK